jgi:hypothetical protein
MKFLKQALNVIGFIAFAVAFIALIVFSVSTESRRVGVEGKTANRDVLNFRRHCMDGKVLVEIVGRSNGAGYVIDLDAEGHPIGCKVE